MSTCIECAIGLDHWCVETHRDPLVGLDDRASLRSPLSPTLTVSVEMPRTSHAHVCVQHDSIVESDLKMFSVALDFLDRSSNLRRRADQTLCSEGSDATTKKSGAKCRGCSINGVTLWHDQIVGEDYSPMPAIAQRNVDVLYCLRQLSSRQLLPTAVELPSATAYGSWPTDASARRMRRSAPPVISAFTFSLTASAGVNHARSSASCVG